MPDWSDGQPKVVPGKKVYLFVGDAGNALDLLVSQATVGADYVQHLRFPLKSDTLLSVKGVLDEMSVLVVHGVESMKPEDAHILSSYLDRKKVRDTSLILLGQSWPNFRDLKAKITRQGLFVDVSDPTGEVGQSNLVKWVSEEWRIKTDLARLACVRSGFSVEKIVWASACFRRFSGGKVVVGNTAKKMVELSTPPTMLDTAFRSTIEKKRDVALSLAKSLGTEQQLAFFRLLESALSDLELLHKHVDKITTPKVLANKTGIHIVRVLEFMALASRYNPTTVRNCRQALQIGFENHSNPEAAWLVVSLWG